MAAPTPNWQSLKFQIPGKDLLESVRSVLETLLIFLEVLKTILETIKAFLIDFGNPIKALVEALIKLILSLFEALRRTGIYAYFDIPNPLVDPGFNRHVGGFQAFTTRFKGSLLDTRDPNRPQPIAGATKSGFVLIVADAESAIGLLRLIKILLRFFGKEFISPAYAPPGKFKVLPLGDRGDPLLSVVRVFQAQPKALVVEWSLPQSTRPGDPGFSDIVGAISTEFYPPRFLIEKSELNPNVEMDAGSLGDASAVGRVTTTVKSRFEQRGLPGKTVNRKVRLNDEYGQPFIKFQKYIVIDTSNNTSTFLLGQLGTFRYIDNDVTPNKTYFYRVRAYSGNLKVSGTTVQFEKPFTDVIDGTPQIRWPAADGKDPPVMGRPTGMIRARFPLIPAKFDVIENLKRVFQLAFSYNFHLPLPQGAQFDSQGLPANTSTQNSDIGKGSLTAFAGPLIAFQAVPIAGNSIARALQPNEVTGTPTEMPFQKYLVRSNSTRLATIVAGAMLENGAAESFRALMQGAPPKNPNEAKTTNEPKVPATSLSEMVFALTAVEGDGTVTQTTATLFNASFTDPNSRLDVLAVVNYIKGFTLGGTPPDWIQVSILRDIIPWSAQFLYELIAKIQALLDAFKGVLDEIKNFIDLLIRKIDVLEQFIQYLISILDFIDSLEAGFYLLSAPEIDGDVGTWIQLIDSAGGDKPPSGPGGYSGGIGLGYVAVDIGGFVDAFKLIF